MYLSNFSLITNVSAIGWPITINAYGFQWDLHNYAEFEGFDYTTTIKCSNLILKWRIAERILQWSTEGGKYGVPNYPANRFNLVFSNVDYLEVVSRDSAMPNEEDLSISAVGFVEAIEATTEYIRDRLIPNYDPEKEMLPFHMMFCFNGGQIIRVGSENAEFILVQ